MPLPACQVRHTQGSWKREVVTWLKAAQDLHNTESLPQKTPSAFLFSNDELHIGFHNDGLRRLPTRRPGFVSNIMFGHSENLSLETKRKLAFPEEMRKTARTLMSEILSSRRASLRGWEPFSKTFPHGPNWWSLDLSVMNLFLLLFRSNMLWLRDPGSNTLSVVNNLACPSGNTTLHSLREQCGL